MPATKHPEKSTARESATPPAARPSLSEALAAARETKMLVVAEQAVTQVGEIFKRQFPGKTAVIVCDCMTMEIAGKAVVASLAAAGVPMREPFIFTDPNLYAEYSFVEMLEASLLQHDAIPVAVGSGTINDLTKLAAHHGRRQYLCVATAASMDGYTAFGASITYQGAKQTFDCPAPQAVVADTSIICRAPALMTASGYADLMAKITAGADWILADELEVEPIDPRAWSLVQEGLRDALSNPAGAKAGDLTAIGALTEGLMLGGFAMQWSKSSRPASGAEHQFSHLWDMEHHVHNGVPPSHGFKVGIATLAVTALYERLLALPLDQLDVDALCAAWPDVEAEEAKVRRMFAGNDFIDTAIRETRTKHISAPGLRVQLEMLKKKWPGIQQRVRAQLLPFADLRKALLTVGAPVEPEEIGITRSRLRESFHRAYHIRRRFTVLDLAMRAGCLDRCLSGLFEEGGLWNTGAIFHAQK